MIDLMRRPRKRLLLGTLGGVALSIVTGCTNSLDDTRLEAEIASGFQSQTGVAVTSVDCPSGIAIQAGAVSQCTITMQDGRSVVVDVTQQDDQGNVRWMTRE